MTENPALGPSAICMGDRADLESAFFASARKALQVLVRQRWDQAL